MKTVNLLTLAEKILTAKNGTLNIEHPEVLADCLKEALSDVVFIDVGGDTRPTEVTTTKGGADSLQVGGSHYKGMKIQHAEFCQVNRLGWCESAAIKYLCRHNGKNKVEDLKKAIHYVQLLAQYDYKVDLTKV